MKLCLLNSNHASQSVILFFFFFLLKSNRLLFYQSQCLTFFPMFYQLLFLFFSLSLFYVYVFFYLTRSIEKLCRILFEKIGNLHAAFVTQCWQEEKNFEFTRGKKLKLPREKKIKCIFGLDADDFCFFLI